MSIEAKVTRAQGIRLEQLEHMDVVSMSNEQGRGQLCLVIITTGSPILIDLTNPRRGGSWSTPSSSWEYELEGRLEVKRV